MKNKHTIKPTIKQKKAAELLVENGGNVSKAMRDAGYSKMTAKTPQKLTESKGFMAIMEETGITDEFLLRALKSDIELKVANRKPELELAFKIKGRLKETIDVTSGGETIKSIEYIVPIDGSVKP